MCESGYSVALLLMKDKIKGQAENQGPRTKDEGPRTKDQEPRTKDEERIDDGLETILNKGDEL